MSHKERAPRLLASICDLVWNLTVYELSHYSSVLFLVSSARISRECWISSSRSFSPHSMMCRTHLRNLAQSSHIFVHASLGPFLRDAMHAIPQVMLRVLEQEILDVFACSKCLRRVSTRVFGDDRVESVIPLETPHDVTDSAPARRERDSEEAGTLGTRNPLASRM